MNKNDLIKAVAMAADTTQLEAGRLIDSFAAAVRQGIRREESVVLSGFGTFSVSRRAARNGRNPRTGQAVAIAARKVVTFKAGVRLAGAVK